MDWRSGGWNPIFQSNNSFDRVRAIFYSSDASQRTAFARIMSGKPCVKTE
jgi:hypothetical protein